jgi:hypothetical protein
MPVKVEKKGDKYRVVEAKTGKVAKNKGGTALDGGGYSSKAKAVKQAQAVNMSMERKKGNKKIPPPSKN